MKFENTQVFNFEGALRGMRNPKDSWDKNDSRYDKNYNYIIGKNDLKLAQVLINAGKEHRKFLRQIMVCVDITAPRYWWSEFDTYKVGTTANSCSTMHKLDAYPITIDMFEIDEIFDEYDSIYNTIDMLEGLRKLTTANSCSTMHKLDAYPITIDMFEIDEIFDEYDSINSTIDMLEGLRKKYNETKDIRYLRAMKQRLPESFLQKRTVTMNYENIYEIVRQRSVHRLKEWSKDTMGWIKSLPYFNELCLNSLKKGE